MESAINDADVTSSPPVYSPEPPTTTEPPCSSEPPSYFPEPPPAHSLQSSPETHIKYSEQRKLELSESEAEAETENENVECKNENEIDLKSENEALPNLDDDAVAEPSESAVGELEANAATVIELSDETVDSVDNSASVNEPEPMVEEYVEACAEAVNSVESTTVIDSETVMAPVIEDSDNSVNDSVQVSESAVCVDSVVEETIQSVIAASQISLSAHSTGIATAAAISTPSSSSLQSSDPLIAPAWFLAYIEEATALATARHSELLNRIDDCNNISFNRLSMHEESSIKPLRDTHGNTPSFFPATRGELLTLSATQCDLLLEAYKLSVDGAVEAKRSRLATHVGLRL